MFSYEGLERGIVTKLKAMVPRIRQAVENERRAAIAVGQELLTAKHILRQRSEAFVSWVQSECGLNPRSANRYMAAARMFGDVAEKAAHTPAQVIYGLAQAKSLPKQATALVRKVREGTVVSLSEYRKAVGAAAPGRKAGTTTTTRQATAGAKPGNGRAMAQEWWNSRPDPDTLGSFVHAAAFNAYAKRVQAAISGRKRRAS